MVLPIYSACLHKSTQPSKRYPAMKNQTVKNRTVRSRTVKNPTMRNPTMRMIISVVVALFGVLLVVLSHAGGVDPPTGTASHYTPIRFARTACEAKIGSSELPPSIYPVAVSDRLWDRGAGCGRRFRVRCISDGAPHLCKSGEVIEVSIQDRAKTMRSRASDYDADMIIIESGFGKIAYSYAHSVPIEYEEVQ